MPGWSVVMGPSGPADRTLTALPWVLLTGSSGAAWSMNAPYALTLPSPKSAIPGIQLPQLRRRPQARLDHGRDVAATSVWIASRPLLWWLWWCSRCWLLQSAIRCSQVLVDIA